MRDQRYISPRVPMIATVYVRKLQRGGAYRKQNDQNNISVPASSNKAVRGRLYIAPRAPDSDVITSQVR